MYTKLPDFDAVRTVLRCSPRREGASLWEPRAKQLIVCQALSNEPGEVGRRGFTCDGSAQRRSIPQEDKTTKDANARKYHQPGSTNSTDQKMEILNSSAAKHLVACDKEFVAIEERLRQNVVRYQQSDYFFITFPTILRFELSTARALSTGPYSEYEFIINS